MSLKLFKKKTWSDESGVSEIIGNILILMITVMLFSGIMVFVNQMPVPELATKTDFVGSVSFDASGTEATLTITHSGGAVLPANYTTVFILIDDVSYTYKLSEDAEFTYEYWATGIDWTKTINGTSYSSVITATVIDNIKHSAVWVSQLSGGVGGGPPTILQRYVDSNIATPTADYIKESDDFSLFVKVIDLDGDLDTSQNGVWVDASSIGGDATDLYDAASGGWFRWDYPNMADDAEAIDGKSLIIHAQDLAGHESISSFRISVVILPSDIERYYTDTPTDEGGLPSYLSFSSPILGSGYGVYAENITNNTPTEKADVNNATTTFEKDARIFVRVASTQMTNILGRNELTLTDTRTGLEYTPTFFNQSTADAPFYVYGSSGSAQIYQSKFNTSGLPPSAYNMNIYLRSAGTDEVVFQTDITLIIQQEGSPITFIPQIYLFSDSTMTIPFGTKDTPFEVNGETYVIYASVNVQDTQASPSPTVGEIRIEDLTGGAQIYGTPPAGAMISNFTQDPTHLTERYSFTIDLRINNADQWLSGRNTYTLRISSFSDDNEGVYSLAKQVSIKASVSKMDFFTGTNGIYSTRGGSTNFINPEYIYHIENNNFFTTRVLYDQSNSPSAAAMYYMTAMAVGDLDGDADDDLIAAKYKPSGSGYVAEAHLLYFENSMNTYGNWQAPSYITRASTDDTTILIEWIATGDTNGDGDIDIVYSTAEHKMFIYNNTYGAAAVQFNGLDYAGAAFGSGYDGIRKLDIKDINGDGADDLIVLANGAVYVYDIKHWKTTAIATIRMPSGVTNIEDFDVADVNGDGMYDILTADPNSASNDDIEGVYVNFYQESLTPTVKQLDESFTPVVTYGSIWPTTGTDPVTYTQTENGEGTYVNESSAGSVQVTFKVDPLSADKDQILHVVARTIGDDESFYIWYSIDSTTGIDGKFTPVIVVTNGTTDWVNYTFRLPSNVADHTLFIRVTDSMNTIGSIEDSLELDYVAVFSSVFGSFMTSRQEIAPLGSTTALSFKCVRAADIDGTGNLEVVAARDGNWSTFYSNGYELFVSGWSVTNSYLYVYGPGANMALVSPTLFAVADVNGDDHSDVVASFTRSDINDDEKITVVGVYINIGSYWYAQIKDHYAGYLVGTEKGSMIALLVADVMHENS